MSDVNDVSPLQGLSRGERLLGFDLGTKTIGLALSDVGRQLATPLETLPRTTFGVDSVKIRTVIERYSVGGLVFGLPLNMDGTEGPRAQATRAFVRNLSRLLPLPTVFWDERLSTAVVQRSLIEQDASRAKRKAVVDRMAAAYILQGAIDRLARHHERADGTT